MTNESRSGRKIRRCAEKFYQNDLGLNINIHNITTFDLAEKVKSDAFNINDGTICYLQPKDVTMQYMMRSGFSKPLIISEGKPVGLKVPDKDSFDNFSVKDVEKLVSPTRKVDVLDVGTQRGLQMTMHQWSKYFDSDKRESLLNVISLEISHTDLCAYIQPPDVVKELDWVETAWPPSLKKAQNNSSNNMTKMKYPKVQKYCLMSVKGSYTDFHLDFGGTSVWYHLLQGEKVFWLVPPTEENLSKFVKWTLAGKQSDVFFGDLVDTCYRVNLHAGYTFLLPGGWIHGVYTPKKSIVFGGNFLHSYNIVGQLQVTAIEEITKVESKYLYPYYVEMCWFVAQKYLNYLKDMEEHGKGNRVLLESEVEGLNLLLARLRESVKFQSAIPMQIKDPKYLVSELRDLLLHAEIDTICEDFSEPVLSRDRNLEHSKPIARFQSRYVPLRDENSAFENEVIPVDDINTASTRVKNENESDSDSVVIVEDTKSVSKLKPIDKDEYGDAFKPAVLDRKRRKLSAGDGTSFTSNEKKNVFDDCLNQLYSPKNVPKYFKVKSDESTSDSRCCENCTRGKCGVCKNCQLFKTHGIESSCTMRPCVNPVLGLEEEKLRCEVCNHGNTCRDTNPLLKCVKCSRVRHWFCLPDATPDYPTSADLHVLWKWKCRRCRDKEHSSPPGDSPPSNKPASRGNIFSKLNKLSQSYEKYPKTNIFSRIQAIGKDGSVSKSLPRLSKISPKTHESVSSPPIQRLPPLPTLTKHPLPRTQADPPLSSSCEMSDEDASSSYPIKEEGYGY